MLPMMECLSTPRAQMIVHPRRHLGPSAPFRHVRPLSRGHWCVEKVARHDSCVSSGDLNRACDRNDGVKRNVASNYDLVKGQRQYNLATTSIQQRTGCR